VRRIARTMLGCRRHLDDHGGPNVQSSVPTTDQGSNRGAIGALAAVVSASGLTGNLAPP
jgi:hypothetical protein